MSSVWSHYRRPVAAFAAVTVGSFVLVRVLRRHSTKSGPTAIFNTSSAFASLTLESSEVVSHDTKMFRFKLPSGDTVAGFPLTSSILTISWPKGRWLPVARPYTPISLPDEPGHVDFLIKRYPKGKQSTHIHSLAPGQKLFFAAALHGPRWTPNKCQEVVLIAGGAGITPCYQMLQGILHNPADLTKCTLVFGVKTEKDVVLLKELEELEAKYPDRFRKVIALSKTESESKYKVGHVTRELLEDIGVGDLAQKDTRIYVSGPPAMESMLFGKRGDQGVLRQLGFRKDQVQKF
ncbi:hypothetical protein NM208_g2958 [Fusarium decemcellulare]|uniref:Uncharacterized protein n=1 Tax=Fusarium decemcellulare TaxID=57161 RepID=A0ACC1SQP2_9HYPO|nr:hypothetical protein NM208_g2958 [Fusarium decemcellulare]